MITSCTGWLSLMVDILLRALRFRFLTSSTLFTVMMPMP
jgi:hypothetical protein